MAAMIEISVGAKIDDSSIAEMKRKLEAEKIKVGVEIDQSGQQQIESLNRKLKELKATGNNIKITPKGMDTAGLDNFSKSISNLQNKLAGSKGLKLDFDVTKDLDKTTSSLTRFLSRTENFGRQVEKFTGNRKGYQLEELQKITREAEKVKRELDNVGNSMQKMQGKISATAKNFGITDQIKQISKLKQELATITDSDKALKMQQRVGEMQLSLAKKVDSSGIRNMIDDYKELENTYGNLSNKLNSLVSQGDNLINLGKIELGQDKHLEQMERQAQSILKIRDEINSLTPKELELVKLKDPEGMDGLLSSLREANDEFEKTGMIGQKSANQVKDAYKNMKQPIKEAQAEIKAMDENSFGKRLGRNMASNINSFNGMINSAITRMLSLYQAVRLVREGFGFMVDVDSNIGEIAMVTNQSMESAGKWVNEFVSLGKQMKIDLREISEGAVGLFRQGLGEDEVKSRLKSIMQFSKVAAISSKEAEQYITAAVNGMNVTAERAADVFTYLGDSSATSASEIAIAMSKVSGTAGQMEIPFEKVASWISTVSEKTRQAPEQIGTSINSMLARFQNVSKKGFGEVGEDINNVSKALKEAADIDLFEPQSQEMRNLGLVLDELGSKWGSLDKIQKSYLSTQLAGVRNASRFASLMESYGRSVELYEGAMNSQGSTAAKYDIYMDTMQAKLDSVKVSWQELVMTFYDTGGFDAAIGSINQLLGGLTGLVERFGGAKTAIAGILTGSLVKFTSTALSTAVIGGLKGVLSGTTIGTALSGTGIATALGGPIGLAIGLAITGAIGFGIKKWGASKKDSLKVLQEEIDEIQSNIYKSAREFQELNQSDMKIEATRSNLKDLKDIYNTRYKTTEQMEKQKELAKEISQTNPEFVVGYDSNMDIMLQDFGKIEESLKTQKKLNAEKRDIAIQSALADAQSARATQITAEKEMAARKRANDYLRKAKDEINPSEFFMGFSRKTKDIANELENIYKEFDIDFDKSGFLKSIEDSFGHGAKPGVELQKILGDVIDDNVEKMSRLQQALLEGKDLQQALVEMVGSEENARIMATDEYQQISESLTQTEERASKLGYALDELSLSAYKYGESVGSFEKGVETATRMVGVLEALDVGASDLSMESAFGWLEKFDGDFGMFEQRIGEVRNVLAEFTDLPMNIEQGLNFAEQLDWNYEALTNFINRAKSLATAFDEELSLESAFDLSMEMEGIDIGIEEIKARVDSLKGYFTDLDTSQALSFVIEMEVNELSQEDIINTANSLRENFAALSQSDAMRLGVDIGINQVQLENVYSFVDQLQDTIGLLPQDKQIEIGMQLAIKQDTTGGTTEDIITQYNQLVQDIRQQFDYTQAEAVQMSLDVQIVMNKTGKSGSDITAEIQQLQEEFSGLSKEEVKNVYIEVGGNFDEAQKKLKEMEATKNNVTIDIKAEISDADISAIEKRVSSIKADPVKVGVELKEGATKQLKEGLKLPELEAKVKFDDGGAEKSLKNVAGSAKSAKTALNNVDGSNASSQLSSVAGSADQATGSINGAIGALSSLSSMPNVKKTITITTVYNTIGSAVSGLLGGSKTSSKKKGGRVPASLDSPFNHLQTAISQYNGMLSENGNAYFDNNIVTFDSDMRTSLGAGGIKPIRLGENRSSGMPLGISAQSQRMREFFADGFQDIDYTALFLTPGADIKSIEAANEAYKDLNDEKERANYLSDRAKEIQKAYNHNLEQSLKASREEVKLIEKKQAGLVKTTSAQKQLKQELEDTLTTYGFQFSGTGLDRGITNLKHLETMSDDMKKKAIKNGVDLSNVISQYNKVTNEMLQDQSVEWWKLQNEKADKLGEMLKEVADDIKKQVEVIMRSSDELGYNMKKFEMIDPSNLDVQMELVAGKAYTAEKAVATLVRRIDELSQLSFPAGSKQAELLADTLHDLNKQLWDMDIDRISYQMQFYELQVKKVENAISDLQKRQANFKETMDFESKMLSLVDPDNFSAGAEMLARKSIMLNKSLEESVALFNQLATVIPESEKHAKELDEAMYGLHKTIQQNTLAIAELERDLEQMAERAHSKFMDSWNKQMNNLARVEDQIVDIIRKRGEKEREAIEENRQKALEALDERKKDLDKRMKDELDAYNQFINRKIELLRREGQKDTFEDRLAEEREKERKLEFEYEVLQMDDSQRGRKLALQKYEELQKQREKINQMTRDRQREEEIQHLQDMLKDKQDANNDEIELNNDLHDKERKAIEETYRQQMDAWKSRYSNANMYAEAYRALADGQVQYIDGSIMSVQSAIIRLEQEHGRAMGVMGQKIITEVIGNWNAAKQSLAEYIHMLNNMQYSMEGGWSNPSVKNDVYKDFNDAVNKFSHGVKGFEAMDDATMAQYIANKIMWEFGGAETKKKVQAKNRNLRKQYGVDPDDDRYDYQQMLNMVGSGIRDMAKQLAGLTDGITQPRTKGFEGMSDAEYKKYIQNKEYWAKRDDPYKKQREEENKALRDLYGIQEDLYGWKEISDQLDKYYLEFVNANNMNNKYLSSLPTYKAGLGDISYQSNVNFEIPVDDKGNVDYYKLEKMYQDVNDYSRREFMNELKRKGYI